MRCIYSIAFIFSTILGLVYGKSALAEKPKMTISSSAFADGTAIAQEYTCQGSDFSPPLHLERIPEGTKSLVLIMDDPDAPDPAHPKMTWVHWVVYDIDPILRDFNTGAGAKGQNVARGGTHGITDFKTLGYSGPCPPVGTHRYFFKLYALDTRLNLAPGQTMAAVEKNMSGHILEKAVLMGTASAHGNSLTEKVTFTCPNPDKIECSCDSSGCTPREKVVEGWQHNGTITKTEYRGKNGFSKDGCPNSLTMGKKTKLFCCYSACGVFIRDVNYDNCAKLGNHSFTCLKN